MHPTSVDDTFCISTFRYVIYADEMRDQRRCLMDFFHESLPVESTREYYYSSYIDFPAIAGNE